MQKKKKQDYGIHASDMCVQNHWPVLQIISHVISYIRPFKLNSFFPVIRFFFLFMLIMKSKG